MDKFAAYNPYPGNNPGFKMVPPKNNSEPLKCVKGTIKEYIDQDTGLFEFSDGPKPVTVFFHSSSVWVDHLGPYNEQTLVRLANFQYDKLALQKRLPIGARIHASIRKIPSSYFEYGARCVWPGVHWRPPLQAPGEEDQLLIEHVEKFEKNPPRLVQGTFPEFPKQGLLQGRAEICEILDDNYGFVRLRNDAGSTKHFNFMALFHKEQVWSTKHQKATENPSLMNAPLGSFVKVGQPVSLSARSIITSSGSGLQRSHLELQAIVVSLDPNCIPDSAPRPTMLQNGSGVFGISGGPTWYFFQRSLHRNLNIVLTVYLKLYNTPYPEINPECIHQSVNLKKFVGNAAVGFEGTKDFTRIESSSKYCPELTNQYQSTEGKPSSQILPGMMVENGQRSNRFDSNEEVRNVRALVGRVNVQPTTCNSIQSVPDEGWRPHAIKRQHSALDEVYCGSSSQPNSAYKKFAKESGHFNDETITSQRQEKMSQYEHCQPERNEYLDFDASKSEKDSWSHNNTMMPFSSLSNLARSDQSEFSFNKEDLSKEETSRYINLGFLTFDEVENRTNLANTPNISEFVIIERLRDWTNNPVAFEAIDEISREGFMTIGIGSLDHKDCLYIGSPFAKVIVIQMECVTPKIQNILENCHIRKVQKNVTAIRDKLFSFNIILTGVVDVVQFTDEVATDDIPPSDVLKPLVNIYQTALDDVLTTKLDSKNVNMFGVIHSMLNTFVKPFIGRGLASQGTESVSDVNYLNKVWNEHVYFIQVSDFRLPTSLSFLPNNLRDNPIEKALRFWSGHDIPEYNDSILASFASAFMCSLCGARDHIACPRVDLMCEYPLCLREGHLVHVCKTLHGQCNKCFIRGHNELHHKMYSVMKLNYCFLQWCYQGTFTCLPLLELTHMKRSVSENHWKYSLWGKPRSQCQKLLHIFGIIDN